MREVLYYIANSASALLTHRRGLTEHHPAPVRGSDRADLVGDHLEAESAVEGHVALLLCVARNKAGSGPRGGGY